VGDEEFEYDEGGVSGISVETEDEGENDDGVEEGRD
jgi:hypothetical protein